jgi:hypothetical protein
MRALLLFVRNFVVVDTFSFVHELVSIRWAQRALDRFEWLLFSVTRLPIRRSTHLSSAAPW